MRYNLRRRCLFGSGTAPQPSYKGLRFKSNGNTTLGLERYSNHTPDIKYSFDNGNTWILWDYSTFNLSDGDIICFKGNNPNGFIITLSIRSKFKTGGTGTIEAHGNIMSLIDNGACNTLVIPNNYCFYALFANICTNLISAPELPATTLTNYCYAYMFLDCTSLIFGPRELPAIILKPYCYDTMFHKCTSLISAPIISATTLADGCCRYMFGNCTSLITAPELKAATLIKSCYFYMFSNCSKLNYIKCLATTGINQNNSTLNWVNGVASTGTFVKKANATWPSGNKGIPTGWTVQNV